jgi:hypothetical protein
MKFALTRGCYIGGIKCNPSIKYIHLVIYLMEVESKAETETDNIKFIIDFLNKGNIPCQTLDNLNGLLIPREIFFNDSIYKELKEKIPVLKNIFSSSYLTALQAPAEKIQRWPLLNLIRQVLRSSSFKLTPKRVSDGYTVDGKKKYKRMFIVERMKLV